MYRTFAPTGDGVLEGFIDLLFEEDGELVVVDYKTPQTRIQPNTSPTAATESRLAATLSSLNTLPASASRMSSSSSCAPKPKKACRT